MTRQVCYLTEEDLLYMTGVLMGYPLPVRESALLDSAVARPQTTVFGNDAYPDVWAKAAALIQSVVKNHPLVDGNKRLGWLSAATFLEINGVSVSHVPNGSVYNFVMEVASGKDSVERLAGQLKSLIIA